MNAPGDRSHRSRCRIAQNMPTIKNQLETLDSLLSRNYPAVHVDLRDGVVAHSWRSSELNDWFAWRNGQSRESREVLLWLYRFIGYEEGRDSLRMLRRELIAHPLNGLIILFLSTRLLYSVPLLIDHGGNGFYFDCIRNTIFHREHAERDRVFSDWNGFLVFLNELLETRPKGQSQMFQRMADLMNQHTR